MSPTTSLITHCPAWCSRTDHYAVAGDVLHGHEIEAATTRNLAHLDFRPTCSHSTGCSSPAAWFATTLCCGDTALLCEAHRVRLLTSDKLMRCGACGLRDQQPATAVELRKL